MNLAEFQKVTMKVIQQDGIAAYLPTLLLPAQRVIMTLEQIPSDVSHEEAARQWVRDSGNASKEYFLAFKVSDEEIHLEHHKGNLLIETAVIR